MGAAATEEQMRTPLREMAFTATALGLLSAEAFAAGFALNALPQPGPFEIASFRATIFSSGFRLG